MTIEEELNWYKAVAKMFKKSYLNLGDNTMELLNDDNVIIPEDKEPILKSIEEGLQQTTTMIEVLQEGRPADQEIFI